LALRTGGRTWTDCRCFHIKQLMLSRLCILPGPVIPRFQGAPWETAKYFCQGASGRQQPRALSARNIRTNSYVDQPKQATIPGKKEMLQLGVRCTAHLVPLSKSQLELPALSGSVPTELSGERSPDTGAGLGSRAYPEILLEAGADPAPACPQCPTPATAENRESTLPTGLDFQPRSILIQLHRLCHRQRLRWLRPSGRQTTQHKAKLLNLNQTAPTRTVDLKGAT
jgi:hypothetical protein